MASPEERAEKAVLARLRLYEIYAMKQRWDQSRAPRGYWWFHHAEVEKAVSGEFSWSKENRAQGVAAVLSILERTPGVTKRYPSPSEQDIGSGLVPPDYEKWWMLNAHEYKAWRKAKR